MADRTLIDLPPPFPTRSGTIIESDEDVRRALLAAQKGPAPAARPPAAPAPATNPDAAPPGRAGAATPFRPAARPRIPILTAFDDGSADGEHVRIRSPRFVIGRTEGDFTVPLDGMMSSRHVEVAWQPAHGAGRWVLVDLRSTHGLFVRVSKAALADGAEFLVGAGRYRFEAGSADPGATVETPGPGAATASAGQTVGWGAAGAFRPPALTELIGGEIGNRVVLSRDDYWIGADHACQVARPDDPSCDPRHARISRNAKGGWAVENNRTLNGLSLRMPQVAVDGVVHFQAGEQRFRIKV